MAGIGPVAAAGVVAEAGATGGAVGGPTDGRAGGGMDRAWSNAITSASTPGGPGLKVGRRYDPARMRVAVIDIGTNTTRLLVADVLDGHVTEVDRRTQVTRLGDGVDATRRLSDSAMDRVRATMDGYAAAIAACDATTGVLTSATRDAANGEAFVREIRDRYGIDAHVIEGDAEAWLTYLGATSDRPPSAEPLLLIDIGGGSTEFVVGTSDTIAFRVSTQAGVVRQTERHLHHDPPTASELAALAAEAREIIEDAVPAAVRQRGGSGTGVAVAGTATQCAAVVQSLVPYDAARVHGYRLSLATCSELLERLAALGLEERRQVRGMDPKRAPTIVAGIVILIEAMRAFGLDAVEVSEHDILYGAAIARAGDA